MAVIEFENESETESESENETKKKKKGKQQGDGDIETMKKIKNKRNTWVSITRNQKYLDIQMNDKI